MDSVAGQAVKGVLIVHGVGAQAPGDSIHKLLNGLALVPGSKVPPAAGPGPVAAEVAGIRVRLYEVHWADLLQGESTRDTFSAREFQAAAWFPWLNRRHKANPPGKYSLGTTLGWTLVLPVLSIALALPYYGARLLAQIFDKRAIGQRHGKADATSLRAFWRNARATADTAAHQRTVLEDTIDEYVGDVFNYVNSAGQARYPDGREKNVPQSVQSAYEVIAQRFRTQLLTAAAECDELHVLAHSLGTVVSYHGLFGLRRGDADTLEDPALQAARKKVSRLYTIGSPLEKISFFWPKLINPEVSPGSRTLHWENFVSWLDPVAGVLRHFNQWGEVHNHHLLGGGFITGHVVYEKHPKFLQRFVSGLGAGPVNLERTTWQRIRNWAMLLGETLLAPVSLLLITLAGAAIWLLAVFLLPWLVSLLFRPEFMPQVAPVIFDRIGIGFGIMMTLVFLINSRMYARQLHRAAWSRRPDSQSNS